MVLDLNNVLMLCEVDVTAIQESKLGGIGMPCVKSNATTLSANMEPVAAPDGTMVATS